MKPEGAHVIPKSFKYTTSSQGAIHPAIAVGALVQFGRGFQ
jgi:hypothetical protein